MVNGFYSKKYKVKTNTKVVYKKLLEFKIIDKPLKVCV